MGEDSLVSMQFPSGETPSPSQVPSPPSASQSSAADDAGSRGHRASSSGSHSAAPFSIPGVRITSVLGHGGFATVYAGVQDSLQRPVAVKVDSRPLDDPRNERRFMREVQAASRISGHPHVVSLVDTGKLPDLRPYLVMELCAGGSLYDLVSRGPTPASDAVALVEAAASALGAAHAAGVMHRDVKPANILLDSYGSPRLSDFGIASVQREGQDPTVTLECLTPDFAAPEAFMLAGPGPEGDVWSMGAVLFALLTGRGPRRGPDGVQRSLPEIVRSLDEPLNLNDPNVPELLLPVLSKAMAPDPRDRYRNGTELTDALGQVREHLGTGNLAVGGPVTSLQLVDAGLVPSPAPSASGHSAGSVSSGGPVSPSSGYPPMTSSAVSGPSAGSAHSARSARSAQSAPSADSGRPGHYEQLSMPVSSPESVNVSPGRSAGTGAGRSNRLTTRERRQIGLRAGFVGAVVGLVIGLGAGWMAGVWLAPTVSTVRADSSAGATGSGAGASAQSSSSGQDVASTPPHPVGTCLAGTTSISGQTTARKVDCNEPHSWEVYQVGTLAESTSGSTDDDLASDPNVQSTCTSQAAQQYGAANPSTSVLGPGEAGWNAGKRGFSCIASDLKGGQRTSSYAG
ncbi:Serine/threonine-protein kinase pknK [Actinomyces viscosus]|uniref:non-specific serine/threonine protein kinase n=1 Tax=Actinomyces viscosus TaxID=1656 RepID=A0A448PJS3_ACTVI|nr:Serine/threonine-protein kinase pknK [Actinomyces viscosus]